VFLKLKNKFELLKKINGPEDLKKLKEEELPLLAKELRELLIDSTSKNGGHVASNLGVVEVSIALHRVFNTPKDKLIWDVGHQSYIHKMLTGRWNDMHTIRQFEGLSGFPKSEESEHDAFNAGHAGTSLSVAAGLAVARDQNKERFHIIPIIGDGSVGCGMALEALNHIGYMKRDVIIILNDNDYSIAPNVGALSEFTKSLEETNLNFTTTSDLVYLEAGLDEKTKKILHKIQKDITPYIHTPGSIFERFGFKYSGPIDGHNIDMLIKVFEQAKKRKGPQIIHIKTVKGKGYKPAEENPPKFHGIEEFSCDVLIDLAKKDKKIVAITPGTPGGTGIGKFQDVYPERFFDVGIAEQHAVTFAAGLAKGGLKPVVSIYSTFLQRAYDQIVHDVCIQKLPVVFLCRSGLVEDGETHQGVFDVSFLRHIPNLVVMSPKDSNELKQMIEKAFSYNKPVAIIHPKGEIVSIDESTNQDFEEGESELLRKGKDLALVAFGSMVKPALEIADKLMAYGIKTCVINTRFAKHIDKEMIDTLTKTVKKVITLEEQLIQGGVGSRVLEVLAELEKEDVKVKQIGIPDQFIEHGKTDMLKEKYGLDNESILQQILNFMGFNKK